MLIISSENISIFFSLFVLCYLGTKIPKKKNNLNVVKKKIFFKPKIKKFKILPHKKHTHTCPQETYTLFQVTRLTPTTYLYIHNTNNNRHDEFVMLINY